MSGSGIRVEHPVVNREQPHSACMFGTGVRVAACLLGALSVAPGQAGARQVSRHEVELGVRPILVMDVVGDNDAVADSAARFVIRYTTNLEQPDLRVGISGEVPEGLQVILDAASVPLAPSSDDAVAGSASLAGRVAGSAVLDLAVTGGCERVHRFNLELLLSDKDEQATSSLWYGPVTLRHATSPGEPAGKQTLKRRSEADGA